MNYKSVKTIKEIENYLGDHKLLALDIETSPLDKYRSDGKASLDSHKATITGISLSVSEGTGVYLPFRHKIGVNADFNSVWDWIKENILLNPNVTAVIHNAAFESAFFYALGVVMQCKVYDTMAAAQLTLKTKTQFRNLSDSGLKKLVPELLKEELTSFESVTEGKFFDELNSENFETVRYACADADYALRLYYLFNKWFDKNLPKHRFIAEEIESPTAVYVGLMKHNGLLMDVELMHQKQEEFAEMLRQLKENLILMTGGVNIGKNAGTKAFREYLYKHLQLPVLKITGKKSEALDDEAIMLLEEYCQKQKSEFMPLLETVREYRKIGKIKSTYIDGYLNYINSATGRIHADLFPLGTETGRFASRNPNLQNCFDNETEILTNRGFVLFSQLKKSDLVAQWQDGEIEFVKPLGKIVQDYNGEMIHITNQHINLCVTPDHRCLLKSRKSNKWSIVDAKDYLADAKQLHAGQYHFGKKSMNLHQIILLCAIQADGSYGGNTIDFSFAKERKYYRLKYALDVTKTPYSEGFRQNGQYRIILSNSPIVKWLRNLLGKNKCFGSWLLDYDRKTAKNILAEIQNWDGCFTRNNFYSSSVKQNVDWMQILYVLTGTRSHLREYWNKNPNSVTNYQIDICDTLFSSTANVKKKYIPYDGKVYCVSVPSGFIVVRRDGQVSVKTNRIPVNTSRKILILIAVIAVMLKHL